MPNIFEKNAFPAPRHSAFDLSREQKLTMKMGDLVPTFLEEVVPGDHFRVNTQVMMRLAPMLAPIMHRVDCYMHYFFVPARLCWNQWQEFITGGRLGTSTPSMPTYTSDGTTATSDLADYLGLPSQMTGASGTTISALPFRAYQLIWLNYYRDQNTTADFDVNTAASSEINKLRKRAWGKDYFTSALPWTQRGAAVSVPANVMYKTISLAYDSLGNLVNDVGQVTTDGFGQINIYDGLGQVPGTIHNIDSVTMMINDLRRTSALQRFLEKMAVGGARYTEVIKSAFGVESQDMRLQRPEYLGGGRQPIVISEVLNTTGTAEAPQGDMTGHGISTGSSNSFTYAVKEHGYIMGILSVLPKTGYMQGIPRHFLRKTRTDYYWPDFALLGEQEIQNCELYLTNNATTNAATFGYQQRYAEYKYGRSSVHGDFKTTLAYWHLDRKFSALPTLNETFITYQDDLRIFADQSGTDYLWVQLYHDVKARRPMPYFSIPELK